jgi:hypothetical protein
VNTGWRLAATIALLSTLGFAANAYVAVEFDRRAAYADWETLFNSDPNWYLPRLTDGTYSSKRHPLLHLFVHQPARAIAALTSATFGRDERAVRRQVVILAAPVASAAKTALLVALCARLGIGLRFAALIALVDITSLSRLVFGSIPESFSATALALVWMFYVAARTLRNGPDAPISFAAWFTCGLFGMGVTLTHIVPFAILLVAVNRVRRLDWLNAAARSVGLVGLVLVAGVVLHVASQALVQPDPNDQEKKPGIGSAAGGPGSTPQPLQNVTPFVRFRPLEILRQLRQLPLVTVATFLGPPPTIIPTMLPATDRPHAHAYFVMPTTELNGEWLWCLSIVAITIGTAALAAWRFASAWQPLILANGVILLFNLALFTVWGGGNIFMFTLYWQPCFLLLLATGALAADRLGILMSIVLVALVAMAVIWNTRFLEVMWRAL